MKKILIVLLLCPLFSAAQIQDRAKLDSMLKVLSRGIYKEDSNEVKLLCAIAKEYEKNDAKLALTYVSRALKLSERLEYEYGKGLCFGVLGDLARPDYDNAFKYHFKALKVFETLKDDARIAYSLRDIGGLYFDMEKFNESLYYFKKSSAYFEKQKDTALISDALNTIGAAYISLHDNEKGRQYFLLSLKYAEQIGDSIRIALRLRNIANIYLDERDYNNALAFLHRSVGLIKDVQSRSYATIADEVAVVYLELAADTITKIWPDSLVSANKNTNLAKALEYLSRADAAYTRSGRYNLWHFSVYAEALALAGRHKEAFGKLKRYNELKDEELSKDVQLKVAEQGIKREEELKENQIAINRIQNNNKYIERAFFIVSALLLGVIMFLIWRNYKKQKKANTDMAFANRQLADEKVKLQIANRNISEGKDRSDELAISLQESIIHKDALAEQLALSADMKTRFLANISHELRTPVTLLTGLLELVNSEEELKGQSSTGDKNGQGHDRNKERLQVAYANGRKLQYMVEEILDLSRHETSAAKLDLSVTEAGPTLKRMIFAFETFIEKERITLHFSEYNVPGLYISVDESMLEKIVNNLVYNAIKFNEPGGTIKVNFFASDDRKQFIFTINNSGSTIKPEDQPHIFERFYQASQTKVVKADGVGIGLSLVKELTSLMNGTIDVASTEGAGTTFTLQFPVVAEALPESQKQEQQQELPVEQWEHFAERQTVLIVEDNTEMRYYLREVLADKVNLAEAANGKKALEWLVDNKADLIISDMMMPEMGGEEFVNHLKSNETYRKIPVITLTALADGDNRLNMLRLGIDDYIVKPFNAAELRVRVYNLLNNLEERRQFANKPTEQDDISVEGKEAEGFRNRVTDFVLERMKRGDISVYDLAFEMAMSERQLYRLSKNLTGCTPAQLIKEVRLQKAYELLLSGSINKLDDVAKQVGFEDPNYFSRQFLERFGKRPVEFI